MQEDSSQFRLAGIFIIPKPTLSIHALYTTSSINLN